jgi:glutathione S-transferase
MGMDKVPILITDCAEQIPQSKAIERYVARIVGMMGTNDVEAAQIDAVVEHVRDIKLEYQPAASISLEKWYGEKLPELSQKLEAALPACVASEKIECPTHESLNYAHVAIYRLYYEFFNDKEGAKDAIEKCPRIQSICASVASHPAVKKWEAERPDTDC